MRDWYKHSGPMMLEPSPPEPVMVQPGCVMVPRSVDEARAMLVVAESYLKSRDAWGDVKGEA